METIIIIAIIAFFILVAFLLYKEKKKPKPYVNIPSIFPTEPPKCKRFKVVPIAQFNNVFYEDCDGELKSRVLEATEMIFARQIKSFSNCDITEEP